VCWYEAFDTVKWFSNSDASEPLLGLVCVRLEKPPPGFSPTGWARLWKLTQLIERFPW
jgi:hypothetical protein